MKLSLLLSFLLTFSMFTQSTAMNTEQFLNQIYEHNNQRDYEKSINLIYEVLHNPASTHYQKYNAYIAKSLTYKRLFNYTEAFNNLNYALAEGIKSPNKKEVEARISIEKFFIIFDLQKYDEMREMVEEHKKIDLSVVDEETRGLYLSALAIIEIMDGKYDEGNRKIDEAIAIFERVSPKDLPNIYGKKMFLYSQLNQPKKVEESFEKALFYAKKYNSQLYTKNLAINMWEFYTYQNNIEKALYYRKLADDLKYDDNTLMNVPTLKLIQLEQKLKDQHQQKLDNKNKKNKRIIGAISLITLLLVLFLSRSLMKNHKKRKLIELENKEIRRKLDHILQKSDAYPDEEDTLITLTERQIEIINHVKQGKTNKEIAAALYISENTVKYHLKIIYNTLGIEKRSDL